jgi:iron-sulfur cluster assembly accessory protein
LTSRRFGRCGVQLNVVFERDFHPRYYYWCISEAPAISTGLKGRSAMSTMNQPEVLVTVTAVASAEVKKFMEAEGVDPAKGGLRVSVQPGGCSGFKYGLLIEDEAAEDDLVVAQGEWNVFVDPFSAQYLNGVIIDYVSSMQGSGFTFKNPNSTGGCGCGSSFSA